MRDGSEYSPTTITGLTLTSLGCTGNISAPGVIANNGLTLQGGNFTNISGAVVTLGTADGDVSLVIKDSQFSDDSGLYLTVPPNGIVPTAPPPGSADALPTLPTGYLEVTINGTFRFLPFY
jgi:hypothetical protein